MSHRGGTVSMHAGDTMPITITVTDDGTATGTPVDLTGAEVVFAIAHGFGGIALFEKTEIDGIDLDSGDEGVAVVTLEPEDTEDLAGLYVYWFRATLTDGTVLTALTGRFIVGRTVAPVVP